MPLFPEQEVNGWLISPEGRWCYHFYRDPQSWQRCPLIFVDKWSARPEGTSFQIKNRCKLPLDDALELCGHMLLNGWQKLSNQFEEALEVELSEECAMWLSRNLPRNWPEQCSLRKEVEVQRSLMRTCAHRVICLKWLKKSFSATPFKMVLWIFIVLTCSPTMSCK